MKRGSVAVRRVREVASLRACRWLHSFGGEANRVTWPLPVSLTHVVG